MEVRDRVKELRRVRAGDLLPHPDNWRTHPPAQQEAVRDILEEIGYADALIAYETEQGLMLIDGHLRRDTTPETVVPVLVLDVDEAEARKVLATLDPLVGLAEADKDKLDALLRDVQTGSQAVADMLTGLAEEAGVIAKRLPTDEANDPVAEWQGMPEFENEDKEGILVKVWVESQEALAEFENRIGGPVRKIGGGTQPVSALTAWFPYRGPEKYGVQQ